MRDGKSYSTRRGNRDPAWQRYFFDHGIVSCRGRGSVQPSGQDAGRAAAEKLTAEEIAKQPIFREMPDFIRRYDESDRPIELRPVELGRYSGQKIDDGRITSGSERPRNCLTIRRCICARWPMRRIFRCSMP